MDYKKTLIILLFVVLAEVLWLSWRLYNLKASKIGEVSTRVPTREEGVSAEEVGALEEEIVEGNARLWLEPADGEFLGQFTVDIYMQTDSPVDGVDVRLLYPADKLSVGEVQIGSFEEYPVNKVEDGLILLSGIILRTESIVPLNQPFLVGRAIFNTVSPGEAELGFDFEPGSNRDSNVAQSGIAKDILREALGATFILR